MNRREFLKHSARLVLGAAAFGELSATVGYKAREIIGDSLFLEQVNHEIEKRLHWFKTKYGISFDFTPITGELGKSLGAKSSELMQTEKMDLLDLVTAEIIKYPPEFIKNWCKLKTIHAVKGINFDEIPDAIMTLGFVSFSSETLLYIGFYDGFIDLVASRTDLDWGPQTFHHEVFHLADSMDGLNADDESWADLNPQGEQEYLRGRYYDANAQHNDSYPGFASEYGRMSENEDQASVAQKLMTNIKALMEKASNQDLVLAAKIENVKKRYFLWSNGRMNEQYWQELTLGKITPSYWG